jgi:flagellar hook-length control protein FliK
VDAAAGAANPLTGSGLDAKALPGAHAMTHRPARGAAASAGQAASDGPAADQAAGPASISSSLPAPTAATAPTSILSSDPSVSAAQAPAAQPVPAGPAAASGPEHVHRHPAAAELPVARQVAGPVLALRAGGDGSHQLIVALHPAELGPVNVHVRIEGDLMTIQLASTSESAHDALRDALPQLRSELQSAGLSSATLSLDLASGDAGGPGAFANPRHSAGESARAAGAVAVAEPATARRSIASRAHPHSSAGLDRWL